jgi:hypothetical protein
MFMVLKKSPQRELRKFQFSFLRKLIGPSPCHHLQFQFLAANSPLFAGGGSGHRAVATAAGNPPFIATH